MVVMGVRQHHRVNTLWVEWERFRRLVLIHFAGRDTAAIKQDALATRLEKVHGTGHHARRTEESDPGIVAGFTGFRLVCHSLTINERGGFSYTGCLRTLFHLNTR